MRLDFFFSYGGNTYFCRMGYSAVTWNVERSGTFSQWLRSSTVLMSRSGNLCQSRSSKCELHVDIAGVRISAWRWIYWIRLLEQGIIVLLKLVEVDGGAALALWTASEAPRVRGLRPPPRGGRGMRAAPASHAAPTAAGYQWDVTKCTQS